MGTPPPIRAAVAACVAVVLVSGCSGGSAPTKQQYVAVADQTCEAAHTELVRLVKVEREEFDGDLDPGQLERFVRFKLVKRMRTMMEQLRGIPAPSGEGAYLDSIYRDYENALSILYSQPLNESSEASGEAAEERLAAYGMKKCATAIDVEDEIEGKTKDDKTQDDGAEDNAADG